jgi:hypothetical protein
MKLIPYVINNGAYSLPDSTMAGIFKKMQSHGLDRIVFYSGGITGAEHFLEFMKRPQNVVHTIWIDENIAIIAWLNAWGSNYAFAHFCCFPETWGKTSVELGKRSLRHWFDLEYEGEYVLDVILGFTPVNYRAAVGYIKKVGMNTMGTVPHIKCGHSDEGMVFSYITREDFNNGRKE